MARTKSNKKPNTSNTETSLFQFGRAMFFLLVILLMALLATDDNIRPWIGNAGIVLLLSYLGFVIYQRIKALRSDNRDQDGL